MKHEANAARIATTAKVNANAYRDAEVGEGLVLVAQHAVGLRDLSIKQTGISMRTRL